MSPTVQAPANAPAPEGDDRPERVPKATLRVAFFGPTSLLDGMTWRGSGASSRALEPGARGRPRRVLQERFDTTLGREPGLAGAQHAALARVRDFAPDVTVVLDPTACATETVAALPGITLGILTNGFPEGDGARAAAALDRLVSFEPALTGRRVGRRRIWRAIPPPVADGLFGDVVPLHRAARAMSIGRSTAHREAMITPAKHHHDLLHVIQGVSGELLVGLLRERDAGVWVGRTAGGSFGWQVAMHLAAGHLLLAEPLRPAHGLERGIDYLEVGSPDGLVAVLDRIAHSPELYHRVRVRGRMKADQFRASRLYPRILHDLLADVAAFGPGARRAAA